MDQFNSDRLSNIELNMDEDGQQSLTVAAKWSKFISITMFIFLGLVLLVMIAASPTIFTALNKLGYASLLDLSPGALIGIIIFCLLLFGVVYYFLFNFAKKVQTALQTGNTEMLNAALSSLKIYFIVMTVILVLSTLSSINSLYELSKL